MDTSIPNFDLPASVSSQKKSLMDIAVTIKMRTPFQLHQLHIVQINLKVIFPSDIVCEAPNLVRTFFSTGCVFINAAISCTWPTTNSSQIEKKIWINFMQSLKNGDRHLTIHLGSNRSKSCHRFSLTSISEDSPYL